MPRKIIWVGGTSGLAKTYLEEMVVPYLDVPAAEESYFVLAGHERPYWTIPQPLVDRHVAAYRQLDLFSRPSVEAFAAALRDGSLCGDCAGATLIFGVRLSLVWGNGHVRLTDNLELLLRLAIEAGVDKVLHVSSVAVVNHLKPQTEMKESDPLPPLSEYRGAYDVFKRVSEDIITRVCTDSRSAATGEPVAFTHIRLGAIYSNDKSCIQVGGLHMQRYVGVAFSTGMDCNSSRNVACALTLLLDRLRTDPGRVKPVYFYTRNSNEPRTLRAYGRAYREAHEYRGVDVPMCIIAPVACLAGALLGTLGKCLPVAKSLHYLMLVAMSEHTFDNSLFRADFPAIAQMEETMVDAFRRIGRVRKLEAAAAAASKSKGE